MFCFGYEHRNCPRAGVIATGILANPAHALTNAQDALKFADAVTIYTNNNPPLATVLNSDLPKGILVNDNPIRRILKHKSADGKDGLALEFEDGGEQVMRFLMHKPDLEIDRRVPDQLGVECAPGLGIKVSPPFNETNVEGVFAAGDCCSPLRIIPNAMNSGSFAGCGLARQLPKNRISDGQS
jgi:thioredoxin reductase